MGRRYQFKPPMHAFHRHSTSFEQAKSASIFSWPILSHACCSLASSPQDSWFGRPKTGSCNLNNIWNGPPEYLPSSEINPQSLKKTKKVDLRAVLSESDFSRIMPLPLGHASPVATPPQEEIWDGEIEAKQPLKSILKSTTNAEGNDSSQKSQSVSIKKIVSFGDKLSVTVYHYEQVYLPHDSTARVKSRIGGLSSKSIHPSITVNTKDRTVVGNTQVPTEFKEQLFLPLSKIEGEDLTIDDLHDSFSSSSSQAVKSSSFVPLKKPSVDVPRRSTSCPKSIFINTNTKSPRGGQEFQMRSPLRVM